MACCFARHCMLCLEDGTCCLSGKVTPLASGQPLRAHLVELAQISTVALAPNSRKRQSPAQQAHTRRMQSQANFGWTCYHLKIRICFYADCESQHVQMHGD